jgi:spermidine synthase
VCKDLSSPIDEAFRQYGPAWGAVIASAVLVGPPALLLAVVSPIVIRLTAVDRIASAAGSVYAVSTVGSIGGVFFTTFWALPVLGTRTSHYVAGTLLVVALLALALVRRRPLYALSLAVPMLALVPAAAPAPPGTIHEGESIHNIIQVVDTPAARYLYLNYTDGPQTVMPKDRLLGGGYFDSFLLGPLLSGGHRVLFLGAAGGTALRQLVLAYPDVEVVGVELDPAVVAVARRFFGLDGLPRLRLVAEDARWYLESRAERFDVIAVDLYVTGHIPFFTATREFFALVRDRLTERGVLMMNVLSIQEGEDLIGPFVRTVAAVFPSTFLVGTGNFILIASKTPMTDADVRQALASGRGGSDVREVVERSLPTLRTAAVGTDWPLFTDDRSDVEFRSFRMFYGEY